VSRARLFRSLKGLDLEAVAAVLAAQPELLRATDDRRRNPLHFLCSLPAGARTSERSIKLARHLLGLGIDIDAPAFVEGAFQATPLWYAISRGHNLPLARFLLQQGSTPEYCLWAAGFKDDVEAIDLLVRHGASVDPVTENETPFLSAIKWSRFAAAERLLHHGANVNFQSSRGLTALHLLLKKNSAPGTSRCSCATARTRRCAARMARARSTWSPSAATRPTSSCSPAAGDPLSPLGRGHTQTSNPGQDAAGRGALA
jgi:ankyrin repeat protein